MIVDKPLPEQFGRRWDSAVDRTAAAMGERDFTIPVRKKFVYEPVRRLGGARITSGPRIRRGLSRVLPGLRPEGEWEFPPWLGSARRLSRALPVLKLVQVPAWAAWVCRADLGGQSVAPPLVW